MNLDMFHLIKKVVKYYLIYYQIENDKGSIIITTNLTFDRWEEIFKDAMLTGAMVDRSAYKAHILDLSRDVSHRYEETVS